MSHSAEITNHSFASLNLAAPLLKNIEALGYTQATPVQAQVIPATLGGGDLLVSSQTGAVKPLPFCYLFFTNSFLPTRMAVLCPVVLSPRS